MKFTLTYEGRLNTGDHQTQNKHEIRKIFHKQLKRLWEVDTLLSRWSVPVRLEGPRYESQAVVPARDWILDRTTHIGDYKFIPLVNKQLYVECALNFRVLRPTGKTNVVDIDNQLKILLDALQRPQKPENLGKCSTPDEGESPFYVLADDDKLITKITSINDELLQPVNGKNEISSGDVRLFVDVYIRPKMPLPFNSLFFADEAPVWDQKYAEPIPDRLSSLDDGQLKSTATQCVFRMRALAVTITLARSEMPRWLPQGSQEERSKAFHEQSAQLILRSAEERILWQQGLWPKAKAIWDELCNRVHRGEPYPRNHNAHAITDGMLVGPNPLGDAAAELDSLIRRL